MTIYEPFCITPQQLTTALHRQNTRLSFQAPKLGLREHIFHKSELIFFIFKSNSHLLSSWLLPPPHRRCNFQQEVFLLLEFPLRPRPPFWCSGTQGPRIALSRVETFYAQQRAVKNKKMKSLKCVWCFFRCGDITPQHFDVWRLSWFFSKED